MTFILLALALIGTGCDQDIEDPVFEYTLKSAQVIETNNSFGLDLLNLVFENDDSPNIMISPASVGLALGMAYNGAETTTKAAFEEVLNYEQGQQPVTEATRVISAIDEDAADAGIRYTLSSYHY